MKKGHSILAFACGLAIMGATALGLQRIDQQRRLGAPGLQLTARNVLDDNGAVVNTNTIALPDQVLAFQASDVPITRVEIGTLPTDTTFARRLYSATNGFQLQLSVVLMGMDRSSIHKPQYCLVGQGWQVLSEQADRIPLAGPRGDALPVWKMTAQQQRTLPDGSHRMVKALYVYWFVADGQVTARHGERMWWMARDLLTRGTLQRWAYVSVLGLCLPGQEEQTYERMKEFIAESTPQYHRFDEHTVFSTVN